MGVETQNLEHQLEARDPDVRLMIQVRTDVVGAFETLVERLPESPGWHLVSSCR